ncbi:MAG TPA: carboxypeptidase-like regulatory domain-containing protein, partial [Mucilaginibacter sp.]|nr:carboxypeptidase-like regulatory domain-containing protein [Mucilaginibacter sp.]
ASIFLTNATIGDQSKPDGTFRLNNLKPGKYELVVSMVGFETFHQTLMMSNSNIILPDIEITAKTTALKEVKITSDPNRDRYLEWFTDEFLGMSETGRQCKIINPEVLNFNYDKETGALTANSDGFLVIENNALGYALNYILTNFTLNNTDGYDKEIHYDGSVFFKEMSGKPAQMANWEAKRQGVYENSAMHFFRAALKDGLDQAGFRVYQVSVQPNLQRPDEKIIDAEINYYKNIRSDVPHRKDSLSYWLKKYKLPRSFQTLQHYPLSKGDIIKTTSQAGMYALSCDFDALYITYSKNHNYRVYKHFDRFDASNKEVTVVSFSEPNAFIDVNGGITNPGSLSYNGVWGHKRVGDLLPVNYDPAESTEEPVDSTVTKNLVNKLKGYFATHITENAYLHFDKPYYAAGDTIYFKAYVTNGEGHRLSQLSNVLHVDLINPYQHLDQSIKLQLINGLAWGEFTLPDSLPKGNYTITAYTQLMRNNEEAGIFDKVIPIFAVKKTTTSLVVANELDNAANNKVDIQFFPEGGALLAGIRTKIAFKAIGRNGLGINVKGTIIDNGGNEVCSFTSQHLGMGYFQLEALATKTYKAKVTYSDGYQATIDLPHPVEKGVVLAVNNELAESIQVSINTSKPFYRDNRNKDYTLLVYSGGEIASYIRKLNSQSISIDLYKEQFHSGILRVTLFSPEGEPLSERLVFIKRPDLLDLKVNSDKVTYNKREKVRVSLNALKNGIPVSSHFSVSVTDETQVPANDNAEHTILTELLLASDLKGYIENPNYYFASDSQLTTGDLDVLMLTQGYRRFEWKQVIDNKQDQVLAYHAERSLELEGMIKSMAGKPVSNSQMILIDNKDNLLMDTLSDNSGSFKFTNIFVTDTPLMILQAKKKNRPEDVNIKVTHPEVLPVSAQNIVIKSNIDSTLQQAEALAQQRFIETVHGGIKLKAVNIKGYKPKPKADLSHSANLNGPGNANFVLMGDQLTGCMGIDCLKGKIPGTIWKGNVLYSRRTGERLGENGNPAFSFPPPPMAIFIDGMSIPQLSDPFGMISINDIYSIEVLESGSYLALYGSNAMGGALIITTKRGVNAPKLNTDAPGLIRFPFNGFYKSREFYSPKYDHPAENTKQKDLRSTIYWKPELVTDKDGNATFEYYNADGHGTYRVIVEGIDSQGNIGRQLYQYKVE